MKMNIQSAINKELFVPRGELLLVAAEVQRARRRYRSFLSTRKKRGSTTFICVSVTKSRPPQLYITKVKKIGDSSLTKRSRWAVEELRQVNGINPQKDSPEFELVFDNTVDHWVASSAAEKCIFVQVLYCACKTHMRGQSGGSLVITPKTNRSQNKAPIGESTTGPSESPGPSTLSRTLGARRKSYAPPKQTEFINCQPKLTQDAHRIHLVMYYCKALLNRMKKKMAAKQSQYKDQEHLDHGGSMMRNMAQRITVALSKRKNRLTQTEDRTAELMHKAQRFAHAAHQMVLKYAK